MCGFTGFFSLRGFDHTQASAVLTRMRDTMIHRGPDDAGLWFDAEAGIGMAHRRLSILDLSQAGHQPMKSVSGRFMLVFNGEIYNHLSIRRQLEESFSAPQAGWLGHSDTETLLSAIEYWGFEKMLKKCVGMFAIALWDRHERVLSLARDRMGEKPLYYGFQGNTFLFGSELKALQVHPAFCGKINQEVLPLYMRHGYIPAPWSIWQGIRKLIPGTFLNLNAINFCDLPDPVEYWSMHQAVVSGRNNPFEGSDKEAIDVLETQLRQSVASQMIADVPLGAFLSGGIDSSIVVALMQAQSIRPIKTFTIGFSEPRYNEAGHAKLVAQHLGTDHTELFVSSRDAMEVIPNLKNIYDEPFGDSSAIPTFLVSQLARKQVTVSLSGDGGDELFGGYGRYFNHSAEGIWRITQRLPAIATKAMRGLYQSKLLDVIDFVIQRIKVMPGNESGKSIAAKVSFMNAIAQAKTHDDFYQICISHWKESLIVLNQSAYSSALPLLGISHEFLANPVERMMYKDIHSYLPDDILVKVDRAAMSMSLESRVPMLDHRVVELAWRMPYAMKVRNSQGKWLLREVLYRYVPRKIIDRPKMGFGVPIDYWLRDPLRDWAEDLLSESQLKEDGFFDYKLIRKRWNQHLNKQNNWRDSIWLLIMFQAWYRSLNK